MKITRRQFNKAAALMPLIPTLAVADEKRAEEKDLMNDFMEDELAVVVHKDRMLGIVPFGEMWVNGEPHVFKMGEAGSIKRKYVDMLLNCKMGVPGMNEQLRFELSVLVDPAGSAGQAWLNSF